MTTTLTPQKPGRTLLPGSEPHTTPRRFAGLDGLRALAVIAVIVYHLFPGALPGGFIGVDVFFVISGFLITSRLVGERTSTGRIDLVRFWVRRALRLIPALLAVILVCCTAAWLLGGDILVGIGRQVAAALTFSSNWVDIATNSSYFDRGDPTLFRNLWSLAVEEQFYLLWPLLVLAIMLLIRPKGARLAIVYVVAVASAVEMAMLVAPHGDATRVYFGSDTHCFGLAIGAALALLLERLRPLDLDLGETVVQVFVRRWLPKVGVLSLVGLLGASLWLHDDQASTYQWGLFSVSILATLVIWAASSAPLGLGRMLDAAPLRFIGLRSYGLYLWHWPVFVLVVAAMAPGGAGTSASSDGLVPGAITLAITSAAALLSYRLLERPLRERGLRGSIRHALAHCRDSRRNSIIAAVALTALVAGLGGTAAAIIWAPSMTRAEAFVARGERAIAAAQAQLARTPRKPADSGAAQGRTTPPDSRVTAGAASPGSGGTSTPSASAVPSSAASGSQITAIGDSVMLASAPALEQSLPGISIDAVVSRQMYTAPGILQALVHAGELRHTVLIGLGTNGSISLNDLAEIQQIAGPERQLVFVTVQAPRSWTSGVNATLDAFAQANPRSVALAGWQAAIAPHLSLLAGDQIHPGMSGGRIYADAVSQALTELAQSSTFRPRAVTWH